MAAPPARRMRSTRSAMAGRLVVRSVYHEMSREFPRGMLLDASCMLSIDATRFSCRTSAEVPLTTVDEFKGQLFVAAGFLLPAPSKHTARITIKGDGSKCKGTSSGSTKTM